MTLQSQRRDECGRLEIISRSPRNNVGGIVNYIRAVVGAAEAGLRDRLTQQFLSTKKPPIYVFGFSSWKTFINDWFPDREVIIAPTKLSSEQFEREWKRRILRDKRSSVLSWQYKGPSQLKDFCKSHQIPFHYVEDGFIRSLKLGALHTPPMSLAFDSQDMYFSSEGSTDLEEILSSYNFCEDEDLLKRAKTVIDIVLSSGISKYNSGVAVDISAIYGPKTSKRVLVVGQVESDASISYGCRKPFTNNDLVRLAREENPDADVIYKPHPEVLSGIASKLSNTDDVKAIARILEEDISVADAFRSVDHVYTITSLSGFEALLRGIKVTTVGCPFYSGWGLTDDRQPNPRRVRKLSIEEVFAAAYILYPKYFDPALKKYIEVEDALAILSDMRAKAMSLTNPAG